mgnify:FL=1
MFQTDLERLLASRPPYKRAWLSNVVEARVCYARKLGLTVDMSRERQIMRQFFTSYKRRPDPREDITARPGDEP